MSSNNAFAWDFNDINLTTSVSATTVTPTVTIGDPNSIWTTTTTGTGIGYNYPNSWVGTVVPGTPSGKITLTGDQADIDVNGRSLMKTLDAIMDRLNLLETNKELEAEWDELAELGRQYRELESHIKEKMETWKRLSANEPKKD